MHECMNVEKVEKGKGMYLIADNARIVEKRKQDFKSGDTAYYVKLGNGSSGGLLEVQCPLEKWLDLTMFEKVYDVEIDARTSGYKHYLDIVNISEV